MHRNIVTWMIIQALARGCKIVCRKLGTYDLEGTFGQLVRILGYKPDLGMALAVIHKKIHRLMWFRETHFRGFVVPCSTYSVYNAAQTNEGMTEQGRSKWNVPAGQEGRQERQGSTVSKRRSRMLRRCELRLKTGGGPDGRDREKLRVNLERL